MSNSSSTPQAAFPNPTGDARDALAAHLLEALHRDDAVRLAALEAALHITPSAPDLLERASRTAARLGNTETAARLALEAAEGYAMAGDHERAAPLFLRGRSASPERASRGLERSGDISGRHTYTLSARARNVPVIIHAEPAPDDAIDCGENIARFLQVALAAEQQRRESGNVEVRSARVRAEQLGAELLIDLLPDGTLRKQLLSLPHDEEPEICALFEGQHLIYDGPLRPRAILELHHGLEHARGPLAEALEATRIAVFLDSPERSPETLPEAARRALPRWIRTSAHHIAALLGDAFPWSAHADWFLAFATPWEQLLLWERHLDPRDRLLALRAEDAWRERRELLPELTPTQPHAPFSS